MTKATYSCETCGKPFIAKTADRARGWARCCGKSCSAKKREKKTGVYRRHMDSLEVDDVDENWDTCDETYWNNK